MLDIWTGIVYPAKDVFGTEEKIRMQKMFFICYNLNKRPRRKR